MLRLLLTLVLCWVNSPTSASDNFGFAKLSGPLNFVYHKFYNCVDKVTLIKLNITARWINETYQVVDGDLDTPIPIGDNLLAKIAAYTVIKNNRVPLANITDKTCQAVRSYLGPLRTVLLTSLGLAPNTCPIPKGVYHPRNVHFDMHESRIPTFPYGMFEIHMALHDAASGVVNVCLGILAENKPM